MRTRDAPALALTLAIATLGAGCASTGAVPRPFPTPGGKAGPVPIGPAADGYAIVTTALALQGVPYRAGGADPSGFDCSGFVQYVLAQHGIAWPRVVRDQFAIGRSIHDRDLRPGDLVFFTIADADVSHVGIAIGGDQFVHAPNARGSVRVESLGSSYWQRRYVGARRIQ